MSPQNWLCQTERNPAFDTLALNSPLGHFNGDQRTPLHQTDKNHGDSKTQSLTRLTTHAAISTFSTSHNSISSQYSQPFTSLAAPKATQIFHAANKNLFTKNPFRLSSSYFFILLRYLTTMIEEPYKLSEETTQRKHTYVTTVFLANNKLPPRYQKQNPAHNR